MGLPRVLEPEAMDTVEEAQDYDAMDHSGVNEQFVTDLLADGEIVGDVLDLGTGTALIPIAFCRRAPDARVMAVDLAISMLDLARYNVEIAGLRERIMLDHVDAKRLPYREGTFSAVISNSIIHHIPQPIAVLEEAVRVTETGGRLFFRDLARPADDSTLSQLVDRYAEGANDHQRALFAASLRAALTVAEARELVGKLGFDPLTVHSSSDRHWTWHAQKP